MTEQDGKVSNCTMEVMKKTTLRVSKLLLNRSGRSQVEDFIAGCSCEITEIAAKQNYINMAQKVEAYQLEQKQLSKKEREQTPIPDEISNLRVDINRKKDTMLRMKCMCWAEKEYSNWEEEDLLYDEEKCYRYHTYKGEKFYLDEKSYFTFAPDGEKQRYPLGFGSYYRSPLYERLSLCSWHGSLTKKEKFKLQRKLDEGKTDAIYEYINPTMKVQVFSIDEEEGEIKEVPSLGPPPNFGVYVYIRYGVYHDIVCYDNCSGINRELLKREARESVHIAKRLREFMAGAETEFHLSMKSLCSCSDHMNVIRKNSRELMLLQNLTSQETQQRKERELAESKAVYEKALMEKKECEAKAKLSWERYKLKVQEEEMFRKNGVNSDFKMDFDALVEKAIEQEKSSNLPEDVLTEVNLYNAIMDYLDAVDFFKEKRSSSGEEEKIFLDNLRYKINQCALEDSMEKSRNAAQDFDELLKMAPPSDDCSRLEKELYKAIVAYHKAVDKGLPEASLVTFKTHILTLNRELDEEENFEESVRNVLVLVKTTDLSRTGQEMYIKSLCKEKLNILEKAEADYIIKKNSYEDNIAKLKENKERIATLLTLGTQADKSLYTVFSMPLFMGEYFIERAKEFTVLKYQREYSLLEEKEAPVDKGEENFRAIERVTDFERRMRQLNNKCKELQKEIKNGIRYLKEHPTIWNEEKYHRDYSIHKQQQIDANRPRSEREKEEKALAATISKPVREMEEIGEIKIAEETVKIKVIVNASTFTKPPIENVKKSKPRDSNLSKLSQKYREHQAKENMKLLPTLANINLTVPLPKPKESPEKKKDDFEEEEKKKVFSPKPEIKPAETSPVAVVAETPKPKAKLDFSALKKKTIAKVEQEPPPVTG